MTDYATRDELNGLGRRVTDIETNHAACRSGITVRVDKLESWTADQESKIDDNNREQSAALADLKRDHSGRIDTVRQEQTNIRVEMAKIPDAVAKQVNLRGTVNIAVATVVLGIMMLLLQIGG